MGKSATECNSLYGGRVLWGAGLEVMEIKTLKSSEFGF